MKLVFEQIRLGGDRNFGYLLGDREAGVAAAIDPAFSPKDVYKRARAQGLEIKTVINTHGHTDHTNGNKKIVNLTGARVAAHADAPETPDLVLSDGDSFEVGSFRLDIMHVPGHSPDHLLLYLEEAALAITGDLLFVGKIGGTGTVDDSRAEYESLQRVLERLPDETTVWPGHDYGSRPSSTIGLERRCNPFLQTADFDAFLELKKDWASFKAKHGLR
ncbi:MAG: MBL fold metallo-hydrolase [Planctomycetota bacterium]